MPLNNVPQAGQTLNSTRDPIRQNFNNIDTSFSIDHVGYTLPNTGKHNKVSFLSQGNTTPNSGATDILMFSRLSALNNTQQLHIRRENNGASYEFTGRGASATQGWTILPSGILLKWGEGTVAASSNANISFPTSVNIPVFSALYNVQVTTQPTPPNAPGFGISVGTLSNTQFTAYNPNTVQVTFRYLAIGLV